MAGFDWSAGEPNRLTIDECEVEAVCFGPLPKDVLTLALLHEGLGCVAPWRDFPRLLAEAGCV